MSSLDVGETSLQFPSGEDLLAEAKPLQSSQLLPEVS
jgi:hypothetical protein